jgi:hypothetical protein
MLGLCKGTFDEHARRLPASPMILECVREPRLCHHLAVILLALSASRESAYCAGFDRVYPLANATSKSKADHGEKTWNM